MNLVHTLYAPAGGGPHPTLLVLHGWGASAFDLLPLAPHLGDGGFLLLCPQGPVPVPLGPMGEGYGWFPLTMGAPPDPAAFRAALAALTAYLDEAERRYPIATDKLALLGFSQGGVMAYALALAQRRRFAALAALSAWLPPILAGGPGASLDALPTLVQHGTRDELIDVSRARESVDALRRLQATVTYREYEMGHEISPESLADLAAFLDEKVRSPILLAR
jgi:phospholipase/carboxylesterase